MMSLESLEYRCSSTSSSFGGVECISVVFDPLFERRNRRMEFPCQFDVVFAFAACSELKHQTEIFCFRYVLALSELFGRRLNHTSTKLINLLWRAQTLSQHF